MDEGLGKAKQAEGLTENCVVSSKSNDPLRHLQRQSFACTAEKGFR
jgi:hypothetical protein